MNRMLEALKGFSERVSEVTLPIMIVESSKFLSKQPMFSAGIDSVGFAASVFMGISVLSHKLMNSPLCRSRDAPIHARINSESSKILIIGDVHGCLEELKMIIDEANQELLPMENMKVILVGDLVGKGDFSAEVIAYVRKQGYYSVMGNHDYAATKHFNNNSKKKIQLELEKYKWIKNLSHSDKQWLLDLPYTISITDLHTIIVHAGLVPNITLENQNLNDMIMMRNVSRSTINHPYIAHSSSDIGQGWAEIWSKSQGIKCQYHAIQSQESIGSGTATGKSKDTKIKHIYFGHDAKRGLQKYENCTGLDTGCCYGRQLSAALLTNNTQMLIQVQARCVYSQPSSGDVVIGTGTTTHNTHSPQRIYTKSPGIGNGSSAVNSSNSISPSANFSKSLSNKISKSHLYG
jgi:bis(5'-nucleosyl)-tetraphosphatase (symmetrical)